MIAKGINYNVEQRAFLETIKNKIADTFEANDAALARLIRIQAEDSTAARLGMESSMTAFLNNMYETTEYLSDVASGVRQSLLEAESLMGTESATEFEFQVQKWLGSLYSVGMSGTAVSNISNVLGQLAAGQVGAISSGGAGNLLVMAASRSGLSLGDILANGLDSSETNALLQSMSEYLSDIYEESAGSRVVQQQMANVFGMTASDLRAASNLRRSTSDVSSVGLSYGGMIGQLRNMANSMYSRTAVGELMSNVFANLQYTTASGIANNPALYALYNIANLLEATTGGIDFSIPMVLGNGTAQTFNIAKIMKAGALGGGILGGLGNIILNGGGGFSGSGMLTALGVGSGTSVSRGTGLTGGGGYYNVSGSGTSESGYVGQGSGSDIQDSIMGETTSEQNSKTAEASESSDSVTVSDVNDNVVLIYNLLSDVVDGTRSLTIKQAIDIW